MSDVVWVGLVEVEARKGRSSVQVGQRHRQVHAILWNRFLNDVGRYSNARPTRGGRLIDAGDVPKQGKAKLSVIGGESRKDLGGSDTDGLCRHRLSGTDQSVN